MNVAKGDASEAQASRRVHAHGIPLLVSPLCLRSRGLGQVDVAVVIGEQVVVSEVKRTRRQDLMAPRVGERQLKRLRQSTHWLGLVLDRTARYQQILVDT
jgi:Holliday junction resolvase-like predicted endonuclease